MNELETHHDNEAERAVLAACLVSRLARAEARKTIVGGDFWEPAHETIWNAMGALDLERVEVDPVTVLGKVRGDSAAALLPVLVTHPAIPEHAGHYAATVRSWATKRRLANAARQVLQRALDPDADAGTYASAVVNEFAAIRDSGNTDDVAGDTLGSILSQDDDEPDWLIPGYLERRDRLMLTGEEGMGKSHFLRQFALSAAAGMDPFGNRPTYEPRRVVIVDCENTQSQLRRSTRGLAAFVEHFGAGGAPDRIWVHESGRIDITRDKDLAAIHRVFDGWQPDLCIIGPLYRLIPRAIQTDDDAAPVLAALDTLRDRGAALLIEAHAGHGIGHGGKRDMRPRGSSALLGWPEFGYGMRSFGGPTKDYADFQAWRGDRSERSWPQALKREFGGSRWLPYDGPTPQAGAIA